MAASPKESLALDANFVLDLAEQRDFAHEFKEEFQFFVPLISQSKVYAPVFESTLPGGPFTDPNRRLPAPYGAGCAPNPFSGCGPRRKHPIRGLDRRTSAERGQ